MITALQNFISKKGKFVFILLLLLVIVSFVLYLSQGSSVFDLMTDGGREKKEFFGYDWNNPDQRRFLNVTTRAAGSLGILVSPAQEIVEKADNSYIQGLQQQIQAAFRANPEEVDQDAMQRMFQYIQAWPNFSRDFKVREIARSGAYDSEFLDHAIKTRAMLGAQANAWDFLPQNINHPSVNSQFIKFLASIDPSLESEDNRTSALSIIGGRFGMSGNELESVLYSSFRDVLVDQIYSNRGFALSGEVDVLSQQNGFAWDGEVAVVSANELPDVEIIWGSLHVSGVPKAGEQMIFTFGKKETKFEFGSSLNDKNRSEILVPLADNPDQLATRLVQLINQHLDIQNDFGVLAKSTRNSKIQLQFKGKPFPRSVPKFSSTSKVISFVDQLTNELTNFHEQNRDLEAFMDAPRTFATAVVFPSKKFMTSPPPADEARLRAYFDRNRIDFLPDPLSDQGQENNKSEFPEIKFEEVEEEVRQKVAAQDLSDAQREAERLAQNASLKFLDELNTFSDRIKRDYPDFLSLRNSTALENFIKNSGAEQRKISFSNKDMNVQAMVLGLERRASEQRSNKEPLLEVESLNEVKFFTRSVRKSRNGYVVFLLDRKTDQQPIEFNDLEFSILCQKYADDLKNTQFTTKVDQIKEKLLSNPESSDPYLTKYRFEAKNQFTVRSSIDSKQRALRAKIEKLENAQTDVSKTEKPQKAKVQKQLSKLRSQLESLTNERTAVMKVLEKAETLAVDNSWIELERNQGSAVFGSLSRVYSVRGKQIEDEQKETMSTNLELSRAMLARDGVIKDLLTANLLK